MPVATQCPNCGKKLKAPDEHLGREATCPSCRTPFVVNPMDPSGDGHSDSSVPDAVSDKPESSRDSGQWFVRTSDGTEYGPVSRQELDYWMAEDRIDVDYQILRQGWDQWKWAEDIFPALATEHRDEDEQLAPGKSDSVASESPFVGIGADVDPDLDFVQTPKVSGSSDHEAHVLTPSIIRSMAGTQPWVLLFSVIFFIAAGFSALGVVFSLLMFTASASAGAIYLVWCASYVALYGFMGMKLLAYSKAAGAVARTRSIKQLEKALDAQQTFWKTMGILVILAIVISLAMFGLTFLLIDTVVGNAPQTISPV